MIVLEKDNCILYLYKAQVLFVGFKCSNNLIFDVIVSQCLVLHCKFCPGVCYLHNLWLLESRGKHRVSGSLTEASVLSSQGEAPSWGV